MFNDFIKDFRFGDNRDNRDNPFDGVFAPIEFSDCNKNSLLNNFNKIKDNAKAILEIGVCRNGNESSTYVFINNKKDDTIYLGVDLESKISLNDLNKKVYTILSNSSDIEKIMEYAHNIGIDKFDYIFIDGWHSINQCIDDWRFVEYLAEGGIVGLHDTNKHPGPVALVKNINLDKWELEQCCTENQDNGITFFKKK
jgi:hypothetical protein